MNLIYLLGLVLLFFWFYFKGPYWAAWIIGVLILLAVIARLLSGAVKVTKAGAKEFTRDVEADMEKASPKAPSGEYLAEIAREAGRKTGEALAPSNYIYTSKGFWGKLGQGAKNFFSGIGSIFFGTPPKHEHKEKHQEKHKHEEEKHEVHHEAHKEKTGHEKGHGEKHH